jgi:hypothetical protein
VGQADAIEHCADGVGSAVGSDPFSRDESSCW